MENSVEKKIDLDKIINKMHQKFGEDGLSEFEKARYLYIELGKLFRFNMNYITFFDLKQEDIYFKPVDFELADGLQLFLTLDIVVVKVLPCLVLHLHLSHRNG